MTRLSQDKLFLPNPEANPYSHQSTAYLKYFGVIPYSKYSTEFNAVEEKEEDGRITKNDDLRKMFYEKKFWKNNGNGVSG